MPDEVDVAPAQSEQFAASHAGVGGEPEGAVVKVLAAVCQEGGEFVGVPGHPASTVVPSELGTGGEPDRVRRQHPAADGVVTDVAQEQVDLVDGLRGQASGAVVPSAVEERRVEVLGGSIPS